ncbi:MAG: tetratricopeptide repeat protein, partial [Deltaproteobacteria bacterium]|nr:tetratricopeptide repeat protein [Deltaproteobacteria bacterium]
MRLKAANKLRRCQQAEQCVQAGQYQGAISIYLKLVGDYPADESLLLALAWAYHDAGCPDKAIHCFEQLFAKELSRKVFTGFAYDELVRIYKASGQYDRLVDVCVRAAAARPQDTALLGELGAAYLKAGMTREAKDVCRRIIVLEPEGAAIYCLLGEAYLTDGEFAPAEKAYRRAAKIDPAAACSFFSRLAASYGRIGEHHREEKLLRKCLKILPLDPLYHCRRGDCLINQGRLGSAAAAYKKALALSPTSAD